MQVNGTSKKCKVVSTNALNPQKERRGTAPLILKLGTG